MGISGQILQAARRGDFTLITSSHIVAEVTRVLGYPRIQRKYHIGPLEIERVRLLLQQEALLTPLTAEVHGVATHPEDDPILATAVSGNAEYLVTGDDKLQRLGSYQGVTIVSPRQFLDILVRQSA